MAQLSMTGLIVALDAYGPVTDKRGAGSPEWPDLPEEVSPGSRIRSTQSANTNEGGHEGLRESGSAAASPR